MLVEFPNVDKSLRKLEKSVRKSTSKMNISESYSLAAWQNMTPQMKSEHSACDFAACSFIYYLVTYVQRWEEEESSMKSFPKPAIGSWWPWCGNTLDTPIVNPSSTPAGVWRLDIVVSYKWYQKECFLFNFKYKLAIGSWWPWCGDTLDTLPSSTPPAHQQGCGDLISLFLISDIRKSTFYLILSINQPLAAGGRGVVTHWILSHHQPLQHTSRGVATWYRCFL